MGVAANDSAKTLRIGCGTGFWGDTPGGAAQLVRRGHIDVLVLDYLSEITMSILARARQKKPELGYAPDFVSAVMAPLAKDIAAQRIKVVTNAGGINPESCGAALRRLFEKEGVPLQVAVVAGDDIAADLPALKALGLRDSISGGELPAAVVSANAYLGAFPIAAALRGGADIVVTGRCVDSALALGPLIAEFDWQPEDLQLLAMGSLAGHIIECGAQATGGISTDWREVADGWHDMGFPIVECSPDGTFVVSKPEGTGGRVTVPTVAEQMTYEVHDPACYQLPDVICDFSRVRLEPLAGDRVAVQGARGLPAPAHYKASLTYLDGYRCTATLLIVGPDAAAKARKVGEAILTRTRRLFAERGWPDYRATSIELLGSESMYGDHARAAQTREVVLKIAVAHAEEAPLELFSREIAPAASSMAQGTSGYAGGRPNVQPIVRLASCLVPKSQVQVTVRVKAECVSSLGDGAALPATGDVPTAPTMPIEPVAAVTAAQSVSSFATLDQTGASLASAAGGSIVSTSGNAATIAGTSGTSGTTGTTGASAARDAWLGGGEASADATIEVPLIRLAYGRSGDKGDTSNVSVIARRPEFLSVIARAVSAEVVARYFAHLVEGPVQRYEWPGIGGFNFVMQRALGGGGIASLRYDPQGKAYAQMLMDLPVAVPSAWLRVGGLLDVPVGREAR